MVSAVEYDLIQYSSAAQATYATIHFVHFMLVFLLLLNHKQGMIKEEQLYISTVALTPAAFKVALENKLATFLT